MQRESERFRVTFTISLLDRHIEYESAIVRSFVLFSHDLLSFAFRKNTNNLPIIIVT